MSAEATLFPGVDYVCAKCNLWRRWFSKFLFRRQKIRAREVILLIAVLGLSYWYIHYISTTPVSPPIPPPLKG